MMTTSAPDRPLLRIPAKRWRSVLDELAIRGGGYRESGAFLLGRRRGRRPKVTHIAYFDDLEPGSLNGAVHLTTAGYTRLNRLCSGLGVDVLADIHTHPGQHIHQSSIDEDNPLVAVQGHVAIIVGHFAQNGADLADVGCYRYDGDDGWAKLTRGVSHWRWLR